MLYFYSTCKRFADLFDMIDGRSRERAIGNIPLPFIRKIGTKIGHDATYAVNDRLGRAQANANSRH